mgnify:CR=1 FL=1
MGLLSPMMIYHYILKQMKLLMTDEKLRKSMSANAIESSKQFSIEIIIKKWMEVINE